LGKRVEFKHRRRHSLWRPLSLWWALPWVPVVALLGLFGIVEYNKFLPTSPFHQLNSEGGPSTVVNSEAGTHTITGRASVIDGDTIEIHGTRIRLFGIDAPESDQSCTVHGKEFRCGQRAAFALSDEIGNRVVSCQPKDRDRYGRVVAVCLAGGEDINAWMVAKGWALAYRHYSNDYVSQEEQAAKLKIGIWQGEFVPPWIGADRADRNDESLLGSPSWSSDRHLQWCVIVAGFDANASEPPPPNRAGAIDGFKKSPQIPHSSDRRLLQQNRHKAYLLTALGNVCFRGKGTNSYSNRCHSRPQTGVQRHA
jgi:endonuclease YncB( thermonuclease family)